MSRYIDADALKERIITPRANGKDLITELIDSMPTIDAEPVRHAKLLNAHPYGECSNCGYLIDIREEFNYCPFCGARMDKDD